MKSIVRYYLLALLFLCFQFASNAQKASIDWKLSSTAKTEFEKNRIQLRQFIVTGQDLDSLLIVLRQNSKQVDILYVNIPSRSVIIQARINYAFEYLLPLKQIIFLDILQTARAEIGIIGYDRSFHGINAVDYMIPGANGKNIIAGVKEQKMEETDLDLWKRVLPSSLAAPNITNHATVIASIIGGAGNSFYDGRGIAWGVRFFSSSFANLFADNATILNTNKVSVQNHSYGSIVQQFYGAEAVSYDSDMYTNLNRIHVFSSGNRGTESAIDGRYANITGYANLTGNFKTAKNIITVGAIDNKGSIPAESSAGPLYDGRLAPQLIALGPNGTSDAAAVVSGTIAVMQQVYADSNNQALPPSSLIKSVLFTNAEDVYSKGIDYKTGYGLLDAYSSIRSIQLKKYDGGSVSQGLSWTKNIIVPAGAAQLKVTLAWNDIQASVNNNKALINDLDLEVQDLNSGIIFKPWVLSAAANKDSLEKIPARKRDSLNTAEQVSISVPTAGIYQVKVSGTSMTTNNLAFHIACNIDTLNTFYFTSPQHASDINRDENPTATIRWKTFVADTNQTGNLFISYNSGSSWQLIKGGHKIYNNQFQWAIKDTNSSAVLKMETGFGNFFSKDFIIAKLTRPLVDFVCADSFRLSWNKHIYANAYRVYMLTDSPYLKPVLQVTDSFVVLNRVQFPSRVYAIEPNLSNGLPAPRSVAMDIEFQGVKCFYKVLNADLLDRNKVNLKLDLSAPSYVDSVYFELVGSTGQLIRAINGAKAFPGIFQYIQLADSLNSGTSYFRARIKLKSGATVFTDIVSILTSGKQFIVLYPNPVSRSSNLNFLFQQGVAPGTELHIYDIWGRLLRVESSLGGAISMGRFSKGFYVYKLITTGKAVLEAGKLIVQ